MAPPLCRSLDVAPTPLYIVLVTQIDPLSSLAYFNGQPVLNTEDGKTVSFSLVAVE